MDNMTFYLILLQSFTETLILIYLGLVLIGYNKPPFLKVMLIALSSALLSYFLRSIPLPPGVNVFIQIPVIAALLACICQLTLFSSISSTVLGFLGVSTAEILFNAAVSLFTGISPPQAMNIPLWRIIYPLPEFAFLTASIFWLRHKQVDLLGLIKPIYNNSAQSFRDHSKFVMLLSMTVMLVVLAFYCQFYLEGATPLYSRESIIIILFATLIIAVVLSLTLTWKMLYIRNQITLAEMQNNNISNLNNMMQIIKAQRHDFINHIQVIYGLLKLGENQQIESYISGLYKDIQLTSDILQLAIPELSAFLLVQTGIATASDISLEIEQETDLAALTVPSPELIAVVGNLLKNAMEAVEDLAPEKRKVKLKIFERSKYYIIQTQNYGLIPHEFKNRIFESGFSTKSGPSERGVGLASVKYQVEKCRGIILLSSHPEYGTRFTVCYPKEKGRKIA